MEEFDELLVQLTASKELLRQLLNKENLNDDWNYEILLIFSKICQTGRSQNQVEMLGLLRGSLYLTGLRQSIVIWGMDINEKIRSVASSLLVLIEVFFKMFPSSCMDMPLDSLTTLIRDYLLESNFVNKVRNIKLCWSATHLL